MKFDSVINRKTSIVLDVWAFDSPMLFYNANHNKLTRAWKNALTLYSTHWCSTRGNFSRKTLTIWKITVFCENRKIRAEMPLVTTTLRLFESLWFKSAVSIAIGTYSNRNYINCPQFKKMITSWTSFLINWKWDWRYYLARKGNGWLYNILGLSKLK